MDTFKIDLLSQNLKGQTFEWDVDDSFFETIDGLVKRGSLHVAAECVRAGAVFKFVIHSVGTVIVPCDRCLAELELRIDTEDELAVKLGADYSDEGDCVVVPEAEGRVDLAQFIYEFIVLSMPIACQHEPGKCDDTMMQTLSMHQAARSSREGLGNDNENDDGIRNDDENDDDDGVGNNDGPVDERWAALLKLKNQN